MHDLHWRRLRGPCRVGFKLAPWRNSRRLLLLLAKLIMNTAEMPFEHHAFVAHGNAEARRSLAEMLLRRDDDRCSGAMGNVTLQSQFRSGGDR